jgi:hypothetical protein
VAERRNGNRRGEGSVQPVTAPCSPGLRRTLLKSSHKPIVSSNKKIGPPEYRFAPPSCFVHPEMAEPISPGRYKLYAGVCFACGVYMVYAAASHSTRLLVPPWVMYPFALVWFAAAARLIEMSSGNPGRGNWFAFIFCAGFGVALASIPWDGHPEACHSSFGFGGFGVSSSGSAGSSLCQRAFGAIGFVLIALATVIAWRWIASRRQS